MVVIKRRCGRLVFWMRGGRWNETQSALIRYDERSETVKAWQRLTKPRNRHGKFNLRVCNSRQRPTGLKANNTLDARVGQELFDKATAWPAMNKIAGTLHQHVVESRRCGGRLTHTCCPPPKETPVARAMKSPRRERSCFAWKLWFLMPSSLTSRIIRSASRWTSSQPLSSGHPGSGQAMRPSSSTSRNGALVWLR